MCLSFIRFSLVLGLSIFGLPAADTDGSCPAGLPGNLLLEWHVTSSSGSVERWFEKFEYRGPSDGHPSWVSTFFRDDGVVAMRWDYVCAAGQLLVTADRAPILTRRFEVNFPTLLSTGNAVDRGLIEIDAGDLSGPFRWSATSWSLRHSPTERATPAGEFAASQIETLVRVYDRAGEPIAAFYLSVWYGRAPDLVPISRTWFEYSGDTSMGLDMELISIRRGLDL